MNKTISFCAILVLVGLIVVFSVFFPKILSDSNSFMAGFVNHELLAFLGVIVTVTLASAANLHLTLNKLEEDKRVKVFSKARAKIRLSCNFLLSILVIAFFLVFLKPVLTANNEVAQAFANGFAIFLVCCSILVLIDITRSILMIESNF